MSQVRVEVHLKSGHLSWARKYQNIKEIGIQALFNKYWDSSSLELTVQGQSYFPTSLLNLLMESAEVIIVGKHHCSFEFHFSPSPTVHLFAAVHCIQLRMSS